MPIVDSVLCEFSYSILLGTRFGILLIVNFSSHNYPISQDEII